MKRDLDDQLRTCATQYERQRVLTRAGTQLLRTASRKPRRPVPPRREEPTPTTPRARGWVPLNELKHLMTRKA
jgi:hypothetical protein